MDTIGALMAAGCVGSFVGAIIGALSLLDWFNSR